MRLLYLCVGFLLLFIGYTISGFAIPWVEFDVIPHPTELHPFATMGAVFYIVGGILVVAGLTGHWALRLLLWLLVVFGVLLWLSPSVSLYVGGV